MSAGPSAVGVVGAVAPVAAVYRLLTLPTLPLPPLPQSARISVISPGLVSLSAASPYTGLPPSYLRQPVAETPVMTPALGHQAPVSRRAGAPESRWR